MRCELDAAFFHLYGIERDDVDYILDTFPMVRRKDEAAHGEYRTKRVILGIYHELAKAAATGNPNLGPPVEVVGPEGPVSGGSAAAALVSYLALPRAKKSPCSRSLRCTVRSWSRTWPPCFRS